ncbi:ankyrin repeat-containing At5g02620-like [Olea europaea subsp. europaea]|uniref:Ankyrin repeat-containing At5g02620-like n=1 Tax=Olea europaea subsp. europaea TaxID=158383 RepID=A0A8S0S4L9_OLEEU|nr:ankyrin repeat-containing At5g02620-like [Olea europaea subsp. europaea]
MAENKLYDAAVKGDIRSLLDLLKEDPLILDRVSFTCSNKTPLHIATICQHTAFVQEIAQRNPLLAAELDSHQSSSLHIASAKGYAEIVKAIVSAAPDMCLARDFHGRNPLHLAAINGQVMVFNELIKTSSLVVQEKADRGQTVLHLCVKHKQLQVMEIILRVINDYEFFNAKNDDGDTILHLAVQTKHFETVQYLIGNTGIDGNAKNANDYTALDILELTPTDLRNTGNYVIYLWRDSIMVLAILTATIAFQAGVTPPGGVWQDNATDNSHKAGEAVMAHIHPKAYRSFCRLFMWSLVVIMWSTVTSTVITYALSIAVVRPQKHRKQLIYTIGIGLTVWSSIMEVWLLNRWPQKRGITMWKPRRFRDLAEVNN